MECGNRTWSASVFRFIPSTPKLHRDSCVVEAFLHGAFWHGLSSVMSEGSDVTSSSLPLYQKFFSKIIRSCQSSTKTTLEPESFSEQLDPPWSSGECGETLLRTCCTVVIPACRPEGPLTVPCAGSGRWH